jgi:hypothetical protein
LSNFVAMAKGRGDDYAQKVTFEVIRELAQQAKALPLDHQERLSHWEEAAQ